MCGIAFNDDVEEKERRDQCEEEQGIKGEHKRAFHPDKHDHWVEADFNAKFLSAGLISLG